MNTSYSINYVTNVDDVNQAYSINMYLTLQWAEPRLILDLDNFDDELVRALRPTFGTFGFVGEIIITIRDTIL